MTIVTGERQASRLASHVKRDAFVISEGHCFWCQAELEHSKCEFCGEPLRQDDQDNNGLCGYHAHKMEKAMRED